MFLLFLFDIYLSLIHLFPLFFNDSYFLQLIFFHVPSSTTRLYSFSHHEPLNPSITGLTILSIFPTTFDGFTNILEFTLLVMGSQSLEHTGISPSWWNHSPTEIAGPDAVLGQYWYFTSPGLDQYPKKTSTASSPLLCVSALTENFRWASPANTTHRIRP